MAYSSNSAINSTTPFENLVLSGQISNIFSLCFTEGGGDLTFGGISPYYTGNITYFDIIQQSYYVVNTLDFQINGVSIGFNTASVV